MSVYIISFFLSYGFLEISIRNKNILIKSITTVVAILIVSIVAGMRAETIGTDVTVYAKPWFKWATQSNDYLMYVKWALNSDMGIIYGSINYIVSRFTSNLNWLLFTINLLTNGLMYVAIYKNRDLVRPSIAFLVYLFLFYNQSLNLLRQSLAVSIVCLQFYYLRTGKYHIALFISFIATLAHSSAAISVILIPIYILANSKLGKLNREILFIAAIVTAVSFQYISSLLIDYGILSERYLIYVILNQRGGALTRLFLFCVPVLIMYLCFTKKEVKQLAEFKSLQTYFFFSLALSILAFKMAYLIRIAYYFDVFTVFTYFLLADYSTVNIKIGRKKYTYLFVILVLLVYWIIVYGIKNSGETVPYIFL